MCGICGIVDFEGGEIQSREIDQMKDLIKHRGPDDDGTYLHKNLGLGFVRLSILDLSDFGHQPMVSNDGRYVLTFNGEIYNYIELREILKTDGYSFKSNTDSEVLLNAYRKWGKDVLHKLNGMWAFTIYDKKKNVLFGARDRYGIKPFYYTLNGSNFSFSSEIPPLLKFLNGNPTADEQAIFDYLAFNRTDQSERTFFKEVKKLQHGHYFEVDLNAGRSGFDIKKWYDIKDRVKNAKPFETANEYRDLFSTAVGLRLRSDVPVGVCLSGGLDSSSIVSVLLNDYQKDDLNTFSAIYGDGVYGDESKFINLFSNDLSNMHFINPDADTLLNDVHSFVEAHAEPVPSTSPYAQFKVMELAKDHVKVTLDGQGADEKLAGYHYFFGNYFKELLYTARIMKLLNESFHYLKEHKSAFGFKTFLFFLLPEALKTTARLNEKGYIDSEFSNQYSSQNEIAGQLYESNNLQQSLLNHFEYKLEHLLKWEDRNSMWFSLESRVPFLDYRLVEKTLALSSDRLIQKGQTKYILREAMRGTLPEAIRTRQDKMGFTTPQDDWFRTNKFEDFIKDIIYSESFKNRGIFDEVKVQKQYAQHLKKEINISKEIWKWINIELWFRKFID